MIPVTTPEVLTEATDAAEELQIPPVIALVKVADDPTQTVAGPAMTPAEEAALTVISRVVVAAPQLPVTEYDIVAVPAAMPVTMPDALTEATDEDELHVPPLTDEPNVVDAPVHMAALPVIVPADATELTAMLWVAVAVPQLLVTV
jgi:hypothetical protein